MSHEEFLDHFPHQGLDVASAKLTNHWTPRPVSYVKINVDESFLESFPRIRVGGILWNHTGDWDVGFSYSQDGGDALLAELMAIERGLELCFSDGFSKIVCESDFLEGVNLFPMESTHVLYSYASIILKIADALQRSRSISLSLFRETTTDAQTS